MKRAPLNDYTPEGRPRMVTGAIGQYTDPAPVCAKPKQQKRPSLREVALSVLARLANSGRREW